jgi:predicted ATPase
MRLNRVYIDGFKNLKAVEARFEKSCLTTVIIGENGAGKSNLIEAIVQAFRAVDLNERITRFTYEIEFEIHDRAVCLSNMPDRPALAADGVTLSRTTFDAARSEYFPDLIFGYYSGTGRRLEKLFDEHQKRYYSVINKDGPDAAYEAALAARRMFYCRPVHGVMALLAHFGVSHEPERLNNLLSEKLGITGFHSALTLFKEPSWFNSAAWKKAANAAPQGRGRRTYGELSDQARDIWGARGPAGACARALQQAAFHPLALNDKVVDDYRDKPRTEAQLGCFIRDGDALRRFASNYDSDQDLFAALEAADISDLFRELIVWVTRTNDATGDVAFSDLSDGERQLLMVLGLIRVSRGREALFLLDEPDTHLNPAWQLNYLDLIAEWTGVAADQDKCQILLTSHNPLTIASLTRSQVRVMHADENRIISVDPPYADPRGMGFTATLTEIFGLPTSLDEETQKKLDERNTLARIDERTAAQEKQLIAINDQLNRLGFMNEDREPLYQDFLRAWQDVRYADRPPMSPDEVEQRHLAMQSLIKQLLGGKEAAH